MRAVSIPAHAKFLLFAAHHQQDPLTLSFSPQRVPRKKGEYVTGRDVGLVVYVNSNNQTEAEVWLSNENNQQSKVLITVSWHLSTGKLRAGVCVTSERQIRSRLPAVRDLRLEKEEEK